MADTSSPTEAIPKLQQLTQEHGDLKTHLAIIRISEPIFSETGTETTETENRIHTPSKRGSDASALDNPTPASLEADLTHYKV